MVMLRENQTNTVKICVDASIDVAGFSLVLAACGVIRTIADISAATLSVSYSAEEVARISSSVTYGTLIVYDAEGAEYMEVLPRFRRTAADCVGEQTIYLTIASTKEIDGGSGGDTPSGDYVTPQQLNQAINRASQAANRYTDEAVEGIETTIIQEQPVHVVDGEGQPISMTVQEAVQQIVNNSEAIEDASESHLHGKVKDEDGDGQPDDETLYLNSGKDSIVI
jgi:hypothetical protein